MPWHGAARLTTSGRMMSRLLLRQATATGCDIEMLGCVLCGLWRGQGFAREAGMGLDKSDNVRPAYPWPGNSKRKRQYLNRFCERGMTQMRTGWRPAPPDAVQCCVESCPRLTCYH
eukprot:593749-Rhodomonas_salina.1